MLSQVKHDEAEIAQHGEVIVHDGRSAAAMPGSETNYTDGDDEGDDEDDAD